VFLDIDHFRRINECLGHTVGDIVLRSLADRIAASVPTRSLVARFEGDTFVLALRDLNEDRVVPLVWELLGRIANPLFVAGHELRVTASAGIVREDPAATSESLLRDADAALSRAKTCRRGGVVVFSEHIRAQSANRIALEADLRRAISRDEFRVYFQPVVRLATGKSEGGEALLRWARGGGEVLTPDAFVPVAEEAGLMVPIGEWVIEAVTKELRRDPSLRTSVNLSPRQLAVPGLADQVERRLAFHKVPASRLAFEVTETVLVEDFEMATGALTRLRRLGCFVGLDDFGVGYSSLSYLRRLPLDFIKLDRSLVEAIDSDSQARTIAASVIALARALSLTTIAEGVERASLIEPLADMGCLYGQGWLFGHPVER
jgi:diguanylate cyclase (GGDEF)-like protein